MGDRLPSAVMVEALVRSSAAELKHASRVSAVCRRRCLTTFASSLDCSLSNSACCAAEASWSSIFLRIGFAGADLIVRTSTCSCWIIFSAGVRSGSNFVSEIDGSITEHLIHVKNFESLELEELPRTHTITI